MEKKKIAPAILLTIALIAPMIVLAEYKYADDYRCVSEIKGGFLHTATDSKLTLFNKSKTEFFLTHISNIPDEAILDYKVQSGVIIHTDKVDEIRKIFEERFLKIDKSSHFKITENYSYFIRTPDQNPKEYDSYYRECKLTRPQPKHNFSSEISCYESGSIKNFSLNLENMRFTYSFEGTWHWKREENESPDSSFFAFGTCSKYFR